jgi:hypothetical protein
VPKHKKDLFTAINNSRQIVFVLFNFQTEYGAFPNTSTAVDVTTKNPTHSLSISGKSSNAAFRQLFAAGFTDSEQIFYADIKSSIKQDGAIYPGECLKKRENAFAYISGLSISDDPATPILLCPLIPGTTKFDPKPFAGKALIFRINQSVQILSIHKDGHIYDKGINLLSPKHPIWGGKSPEIHYPDL